MNHLNNNEKIRLFLRSFSSLKSFTGNTGAGGAGNAVGTTKTTSVGGTQLIVNPKNLQQSTVTVQQIMRQQPNQIVLGKRIIPVSVSSQNARQTIQVRNKRHRLEFSSIQNSNFINMYF